MDSTLVEKTKAILQPLISQTPETLFGLEKIMYNAKIVQELEDDKKLVLKNLIDSIVLRMPDMDASDIDMGRDSLRHLHGRLERLPLRREASHVC